MSPTVVLLWTLRLTCWPDEVEGHGAPAAPPVAAPEPPAPAAAPPPSPSTPPPATAAPSSSTSAAAPAASVGKAPHPDHPRAAALPVLEEARYEVRYGLLGSVGEVTVSAGAVGSGADGARVLKLRGAGRGAVLGLGAMRRRIESELDLSSLGPRRWTAVRSREADASDAGEKSSDTIETGARTAGNVWALERGTRGQPPARQSVTFQVPTGDPLSLLWRLRAAPPAAGKSETHQLLDGVTLWRVDVTAARAAEILPGNETAIRLDGSLAPIAYDGRPDPDRPSRTFTLWMSDRPGHLPLRLEVPVGFGDVVFTLTEARKQPTASPTPPPRTPSSPAVPPPGPAAVQVVGPAPGARSL